MAYLPLLGKSDTIAVGSTLNSGATSTTLTTGNFGTPTGLQLYVVDYDVPASAEIITASVAGTAMTSITRGLTGGAASTTNHAAGAKIGSIIVPQLFGNGIGAVAANDAFTAFTSSPTGYSVAPTIDHARYFQLGKLVIVDISFSAGTSNATTLTFTLPVAAKSGISFPCQYMDNGSNATTPGRVITSAASTTATCYTNQLTGGWTAANGKGIIVSMVYESN